MKNMKKLVALFAATVMTMSLSVSAFAATVETTVGADDANIADEAFNLVFTAPEGGETDVDQLTMIAYLVPDTTTLEAWVPYDGTQTIVAINQVGGDVGFGSVPVDVAKLTAGNSVAVAIGGTDVGTTAKYLVTYSTTPETVTYAIVYELADGTAEGNPTASNSEETIADFFAKVATAPTKEGFTFKHWSKTADGEAINTASEDKMSTLLDAGSTTTVTLYAVYETAVNAIYVTFMNGSEIVDTIATVDGKAVLSTTTPTLATVPGYATTAYTFVEWVDKDGNPVTAETSISADTTVYAKFKSNFTTGDITGDGVVKSADRGRINNFLKNGANQDTVQIKITHLDETIVTGDITGDSVVKSADRGRINNFLKNGANQDTVNIPIYVVNK